MIVLSEAGLLATWEAGLGQNRVRRALTLAAAGGADPGSVADLSVGRREAFVLALRERWFGRTLPCAVTCPACAEHLELELTTDDVRTDPSTEPEPTTVDGTEVEFRLVTSRDLIAVRPELPDARRTLLRRCVVSATSRGRGVPAAALPDPVLDAVAAALSTLDPQADVLLDLDCVACGHGWRARFDVAAYLWEELDAYARRLLHEVHALASAYGWSEDEVLAVSPVRRRWYLEMAAS
ncbi:MAG TPA: hypothetical protein VGX25_18390 [Actinophytocola sp.]|uniref:T4 family baseplate hub assembly chaperone n=1 Tax=Actinophytocola sp. TaxID=1872138 RepID=UPI002DDD251E|nr:hypothetical protein [Actinophytocola sp.]HEV2781356.1 hypothetical protein [Actinophytocola sp.]